MKEWAVVWTTHEAREGEQQMRCTVDWYDELEPALKRRRELLSGGFAAWVVMCPPWVPVLETDGVEHNG